MSTVKYLMVLYSRRLVWPVLILHKCASARKERERVQTYAKDTTRKMKTDPKLFDTDDDGENPRQKKKYNPHKGTEQSSPLVLLTSVETWHGRNKMFSVC